MSPIGLASALERGLSRLAAATPTRVKRLIAGAPIRIDGQELHPDAQAMLRIGRLLGSERADLPIDVQRAKTRREARLVAGRQIAVGAVESLTVPGGDGPLDARLYVPEAAADEGPLTVYFHGGGWCIGDLHTHDQSCRYLCRRSRARVLSVAYRLAPEHPFPAPLDDAIATFRFVAADGGAALGADPGRIAIAGDSAGANLATVAARLLRDEGGPTPVFQALSYPVADLSRKRPSYRLFAEGFYLTERRMHRWHRLYLADRVAADDPCVSPLLADDLAGLPPAYVLVAGFDPLRDEVREYASALTGAGVEVTMGEALDLFHGFISAVGVSARFRAAIDPLADALGAALG